jgi:hypothetical protein
MLASFVPVCLVGLGLLAAVGVATLWAEAGGKRQPPHGDAEGAAESDPWDDQGGAGRPQQPDDEAEGAAEDDERPWERPGAVRRDCEPDRGTTLLWLGRLSLWLIVLGVLLGVAVLLPVLALAIAVLVMAARDRAKMRAGTMDPAGEALTRKGARYAKAALGTVVLTVLAIVGLAAAVIGFTAF